MSKVKIVKKSKYLKHEIVKDEQIVKDEEIPQTEIDKLMGIDENSVKFKQINKNEWKQCIYCVKYHHIDYYISNADYCIHCWAWLNSHEYDIEQGIYNGTYEKEEIDKAIKKVYKIHLKTECKMQDCFFNKIKKYIEINLLHKSLIELLELNKKPKLRAVSFNYKNKNLDVNYEESYIVI